VLWVGNRMEGPYTGRIAGRLGIQANSPERVALDQALWELRRAHLAHFEYDQLVDNAIRWTITAAGVRALG